MERRGVRLRRTDGSADYRDARRRGDGGGGGAARNRTNTRSTLLQARFEVHTGGARTREAREPVVLKSPASLLPAAEHPCEWGDPQVLPRELSTSLPPWSSGRAARSGVERGTKPIEKTTTLGQNACSRRVSEGMFTFRPIGSTLVLAAGMDPPCKTPGGKRRRGDQARTGVSAFRVWGQQHPAALGQERATREPLPQPTVPLPPRALAQPTYYRN
jgi:hypothetical protein